MPARLNGSKQTTGHCSCKQQRNCVTWTIRTVVVLSSFLLLFVYLTVEQISQGTKEQTARTVYKKGKGQGSQNFIGKVSNLQQEQEGLQQRKIQEAINHKNSKLYKESKNKKALGQTLQLQGKNPEKVNQDLASVLFADSKRNVESTKTANASHTTKSQASKQKIKAMIGAGGEKNSSRLQKLSGKQPTSLAKTNLTATKNMHVADIIKDNATQQNKKTNKNEIARISTEKIKSDNKQESAKILLPSLKFQNGETLIKANKIFPREEMPDFDAEPTVENFDMLNTGTHLMIISYMRSGSSMNGKVFRDNEDDFYIYEPLNKFAPYHYLAENRFCNMRDPKCSKHDLQGLDVSDRIELTIKALKNIYSCNIRRLDDTLLRSIMFENQSGRGWSDFVKCYVSIAENKVFLENIDNYLLDAKKKDFDKHKNILRYLDPPGPRADMLNSCFEKLETRCRTATLRVTKELRLSLRLVPRLLNIFPKLKIMFVLRDPRGIMNSRIQTPWFPVNESKPGEVVESIKSLCYKMDSDVKMIKFIKRDFPGRLIDFRLEDITAKPLESFKTIFKFLNATITDNHIKNIEEIFMTRPNFQTKWVTSLKERYIRLTEEGCQNVFKHYNYFRMYS